MAGARNTLMALPGSGRGIPGRHPGAIPAVQARAPRNAPSPPIPVKRPIPPRLVSTAMRVPVLVAVTALLVLTAGCSTPSTPGLETPATTIAPATSPASGANPVPAATSAPTHVPTLPGASIPLGADPVRIASAGGTEEVPIVLASAPNGLSGYSITVALDDPSIAEITAVSFPDWAQLSSSPGLPSDRANLRAVDITSQVPVNGENVLLATISVRAKAAGTTNVSITPEEGLGVQDREGDIYPVVPVPVSLTVGA